MKKPPVLKNASGESIACARCWVNWARYLWNDKKLCLPCMKWFERRTT